jgi:hypothetical protein
MSTIDYLDLYCERTAPGLWNEPLNAVSNLAFLIAAVLALQVARRRGKPDWPEIAVIALGGAIGIGSFLFHIFANAWSERADVIPIWSFVASFVLLVIYRSTGESPARTLRTGAIAAGITAVVLWFTSADVTTGAGTSPEILNGSLQYAPAQLALAVFAALATLRRHPARRLVVAAAVTFLVSLILRSMDLATCEATGVGTHFLWHLLNGVMVGLLLHALVRHFPPAAVGQPTAARVR